EVDASDALFARLGVGIWLVSEPAAPDIAIGFAGFRVFAETGPEPQLLYALLPAFTGRGYATEIARALIAYAFDVAGLDRVLSAADAPNVASIRVLEKVGLRRAGTAPGAF